MYKKIAYRINSLEEYAKFTLWCAGHDLEIRNFNPGKLYLRSTVFEIDPINKYVFVREESYCLVNNIPIFIPSFFVNSKDEVEVVPATGEKELLYECEECINKYLTFVSSNGSKLTKKETLKFRTKLSSLLRRLNNYE